MRDGGWCEVLGTGMRRKFGEPCEAKEVRSKHKTRNSWDMRGGGLCKVLGTGMRHKFGEPGGQVVQHVRGWSLRSEEKLADQRVCLGRGKEKVQKPNTEL